MRKQDFVGVQSQAKHTAPSTANLLSRSRVMTTFAISCCLFASSAFAGGVCPDPACGPGSCLSLKAVAINGNPIAPTSNVTASRGDTIETEIWLSCWGTDLGLLRSYQALINGKDGVVSGDAGLVLPLGWDAPLQFMGCTSQSDCPLGTSCPGGQCIGSAHFPDTGAFIDPDRADNVIRDFDPLFFVGTIVIDYILGGASREPTGAADTGEPKYGGTLLLTVSDEACGQFTFDFVTTGIAGISEFIATDLAIRSIPNTQPLYIQTHDCDCNDNGVFDDEELATGAAADCDSNGLPDDCDPDCDGDGTPDECEISNCNGDRACSNCNQNGVPDGCDIASGTSNDIDNNGTPRRLLHRDSNRQRMGTRGPCAAATRLGEVEVWNWEAPSSLRDDTKRLRGLILDHISKSVSTLLVVERRTAFECSGDALGSLWGHMRRYDLDKFADPSFKSAFRGGVSIGQELSNHRDLDRRCDRCLKTSLRVGGTVDAAPQPTYPFHRIAKYPFGIEGRNLHEAAMF